MDMQKVENSSTIASRGYEPATQTMRVEFKSGKTYEYEGIPLDAEGEGSWNGWLSAESAGSYFAHNFRHRKTVKLDDQ